MNETQEMIENLMKRAKIAQEEYSKLTQKDVDRIIKQMAMAVQENHMMLARIAVDETKRGIYEDKITKNIFASEYIYHSIKHNKTVGIVNDNAEEGYMEIAEPIGIIAGVTPVTNPTSTTCFKSLIAAKTRNVIVFGFHPSAQKCSVRTAQILLEAAVKAGAPKDCILWIDKPSVEATKTLMNHKDISLILATGGKGMVKSAYSCGKPALGVGPGNVPCYIHKDAKLKVYVYTDYMCPICPVYNKMIHKLAKELKGFEVIHRDLPLDMECNKYLIRPFHNGSCRMAKYAAAAEAQGKFWDVNSLFFEKKPQSEQEIKAIAEELGLNFDEMKKYAESKEVNDNLLKGIDNSYAKKIDATPSMLIEDEVVIGLKPYDDLKAILIKHGAKKR